MNKKIITGLILIVFSLTGFRPFAASLLSDTPAVKPDGPVVAVSSIPSYGLAIPNSPATDTLWGTPTQEPITTPTDDSLNSGLFSSGDDLSVTDPNTFSNEDDFDFDLYDTPAFSNGLNAEQWEMVNDALIQGGTALIQNADLDAAYFGAKEIVNLLAEATKFWEGFDFATLDEGFQSILEEAIYALGDESFPKAILEAYVQSPSAMPITTTIDGETVQITISQVSENEFLFDPIFSLELDGDIARVYEPDGTAIAEITRRFDATQPNQVVFTVETFEDNSIFNVVYLHKDGAFLININGEEMVSLRTNPEKSAFELSEKITPSETTLTFSPDAGTITLINEATKASDPSTAPLTNDPAYKTVTETKTFTLLIDQELKALSLFSETENLFLLRFVDDSQIAVGIAEKSYLLNFDDVAQNIRWQPEEAGETEVSLTFSGAKNQLALQAGPSGTTLADVVTLQFDKVKNAIDLLIPGVEGGYSIIFDEAANQILLNMGGYEFPLDPAMLEMYSESFMP